MSIFKFISIPFLVVSDVMKMFLIYMPGATGIRLRRLYYQRKFKSCGVNLVVDIGVSIDGAELISVGDDVYIDKYCIIATGKELIGHIHRKQNKDTVLEEGEIKIGSDIHIAHFCVLMGYGGIVFEDKVVLSSGSKIYSLTNTAYDLEAREEIVSIMPYSQANFLIGAVTLKSNVWLGLNTIIMPHVEIGCDSFCASNSLLTQSFEDNSYIAGQPAQRRGDRFKAVGDGH